MSDLRDAALSAKAWPFEEARRDARKIVTEKGGGFIEIFVDTPVEVFLSQHYWFWNFRSVFFG